MKTENATLPSGCGFCGNTGNLQRCSSCKAVSYCNRDHQAAHRPAHKSACIDILKARQLLELEEVKLRDHPGDDFTAGDIFNSCEGMFWGILETRDYMRARFGLVADLQQVDSQDSVQLQLDHTRDMLRLCRSDNMGVRYMIPAMMLRLNKDQDCYDFIKWWATTGNLDDYDWGNMDLPYLDVKGADAFESVDYLCDGDPYELNNTVAVTLLKIKLLLDLTALQDSSAAGNDNAIRGIVDKVRDSLPRSSIVRGNKEIMGRNDHTTAINTLRTQIEALYRAVNKANKHFWPGLHRAREHLMTKPGVYSPGSKEQMQLALLYSYDAWMETPGAMEFIRSMS